MKAVSTLHACVLLIRHGYAQEVGALCRIVDHLCNEIFFVLAPLGEDGLSSEQISFLENFFAEEFDRPNDPLRSEQKRITVPVRKVHATFGKLAREELNPSDTQELLRTVHQALSGYVHGAYPHIMEMFGGDPPHFHMSGMLGSPRVAEWRAQLVGYVQSLIITSIFVARKLGKDVLETPMRTFLEEYQARTGTKPDSRASAMLDQYKSDRAT